LLAGQRAGLWTAEDPFTREALVRLRHGEPPERTGFPAPRLGPAARIGPMGVVLRADSASLLRASMESSLLTHADLRAGAFAFAVAYSVGRLVDGEDPRDVASMLPLAVQGVEESWTMPRHPTWERETGAPHAVSGSLRSTFRSFPPNPRPAWTPEALREHVCQEARGHLPKHADTHPNGWFVLLGGLHALTMGLAAPWSPRDTLCAVIDAGGPAASMAAAIAGTLLGARHGSDWIGPVPARVSRWAYAIASGQPAEDRDAFVGGLWAPASQ